MAHAHMHHGADRVITGEEARSVVGHEHHADDRRAARAARHLHGRPAAVAARSRRQPAGRDQERQPDAGRRLADRDRVHRRPEAVDQQAGHADRASSKIACARSTRSARTRPCSSPPTAACATATSSKSSTPPRARASRRSASSPRACAAPRPRPDASAATSSPPTAIKATRKRAAFCLYAPLSGSQSRQLRAFSRQCSVQSTVRQLGRQSSLQPTRRRGLDDELD